MLAYSCNSLSFFETDLLVLEHLLKSKVVTSQSLERNNKILLVFIPDLLILSGSSLIFFLNVGLELRVLLPLLGQISSGSLNLQGFILRKLLLDKLRIRAGGSLGWRWDEEASLFDDVFSEVEGSGGGEAEEIIVANQAEHLNLN